MMVCTSESIELLAKALVKVQGEFEAVSKTAENPFFKAKYAALPAIVMYATPILSTNGLAVSQLLGYDGELDTLTTRLIHDSGQWIESTMRLHMTKTDAQGHGSSVTYGRRYAYMAILGLVADEDDDGCAASKTTQSQAPTSSGQTTTRRPPPVQNQPAQPKADDAQTKPVNMKRLFALINGSREVGKEDGERHKWASAVLGRAIQSFTELTAADVKILEDALKDGPPPPAYAPGEEEF